MITLGVEVVPHMRAVLRNGQTRSHVVNCCDAGVAVRFLVLGQPASIAVRMIWPFLSGRKATLGAKQDVIVLSFEKAGCFRSEVLSQWFVCLRIW